MDAKKIEILEKATAIFLKYGIKSVTMDDMARELGMSKKTLYTYFNDKNDLVLQIINVKTTIDRNQCICAKQEAENAIDEMFQISSYISAMLKNIHPTVFYDLRRYHPDAMNVMHEHKWKFVKQSILENIERGKKEGIYRSDVNSELVASIYVGSTDQVSDGTAFTQLNHTVDTLFKEIIKFFLYGMVNDTGRAYLIARNNEQ